jgi:hypothetical protein
VGLKRQQGRAVTQEHSMGCGIACVAFLLNLPYRDVLSRCRTKRHAWTRGFYCRELVTLLKKNGKTYRWRAFSRIEKNINIPNGSIVFLKPCQSYPLGHFLVKVANGKYMNPWINFPEMNPVNSGFQTKIGIVSYIIVDAVAT